MASTYKQEVERTETFKNQLNSTFQEIQKQFLPFGRYPRQINLIPLTLESMPKIFIDIEPRAYTYGGNRIYRIPSVTFEVKKLYISIAAADRHDTSSSTYDTSKVETRELNLSRNARSGDYVQIVTDNSIPATGIVTSTLPNSYYTYDDKYISYLYGHFNFPNKFRGGSAAIPTIIAVG